MRKLVVNLILMMTLAACHPSGKEVAGKYYTKHNKGTEYIELFENGTFIHYFKNDTVDYKEEGTWGFETRMSQERFFLSGYVEYVAPMEDGVNPWGKPGHVSGYWESDLISFHGDGYDEYNFHREKKE